MVTPDTQDSRNVNYGTATDQTDNLATAEVAGQSAVGAEVPKLAGYMPSWWVLPAIGAAMLLSMLVAYLGVRYGQDAIALSGVALFGLMICVLLGSFVRYTWLLVREISDWRRSTKRVPKI